MDPITIALTAAKYAPLIKSGWDWLTKKKGPSRSGSVTAAERAYMKNLQQRMKMGMSPQQVNQMMSTTTRAQGIETNLAKTNIQGMGVKQGIEDSGVLAEQMTNVDLAGSEQIAITARRVAEKNIEIQNKAQKTMGEIGIKRTDTAYNEALEHYATQEGRISSVLGGVSEIGSNYLATLEQSGQMGRIGEQDWFKDLTADQKAKIMELLMQSKN